MKFNKKRITILVSLMCLLVLLVFTLCSFDLPTFNQTAINVLELDGDSIPTTAEQSLILAATDYQYQLGCFNKYVPMVVYIEQGATYRYIRVLCVPVGLNFTLTVGSTFIEWSGTGETYCYLGTDGTFIQGSNSSSRCYTSLCLGYRTSASDPFTINPLYSGSDTDSARDIFIDIDAYWSEYYSIVTRDFSSELQTAYDDGYSHGFDTGFSYGEQFGYQEGYTEGYQEGIGTGYMHGFQAGEAEGYVTGYHEGYEDGYDSGYETGYSDGLEDAPPETVTIVIYEEPVEIDVPGIISSVSSIPDSILSGSFDFEFAGINIYGLLKLLIIVFIISAVIFFIIKRSA